MQTLKKYYFGKQKAKVNTFIGGIGGTINTPALLASKLGISESRIKSFKVIAGNIECAIIGGGYNIPSNAFLNNNFLTYYDDSKNLVSSIGASAFRGCTSLTAINIVLSGALASSIFENTRLTTVDLKDVTIIGANVFAFVTTLTGNVICNKCTSISNGAFYNTGIQSFTANVCAVIGNVSFFGCTQCTAYNFPELLSINDYSVFQNNYSLISVNIPKVNLLGSSNSSYNEIFRDIKLGCSITVPNVMQTINSGSVEPDILYAVNSRGAIITYV